MSTAVAIVATALVVVALVFFAAGTAGVLRFPDVYNRLHAVTKADNVGLGFLILALVITSPSALIAAKHIAIWIFALITSTTACHLIARAALQRGIEPWRPR